jgi:hypothetical protein
MRHVHTVLAGKSEGNRPLGRTGSRCEDNIKIHLKEIGCGVWTGFTDSG